MQYENQFLFSLLLTLAVEIPVAVVFVVFVFKSKEIKLANIVGLSFLASVLTLPYFWFVLPAYFSSRGAYIFSGELLVVLAETVIYFKLLKLKLHQSFLLSLAANLASILLGIVLF
jgi:hypothetical protein